MLLLAEETSVGHSYYESRHLGWMMFGWARSWARELIFHLVNGKKKNFHSNVKWSWHVVKIKTHLGPEESVQWVKYFLYKIEDPDSFTRTHMKKPDMVLCACKLSAGRFGGRDRQTPGPQSLSSRLVRHPVFQNNLGRTWWTTSDILQAPHSHENIHIHTHINTHVYPCVYIHKYMNTPVYIYIHMHIHTYHFPYPLSLL